MSGQAAVTHFRLIERKDETTIVEAELETGRTHQIRVHLSHIGNPVKGDTLIRRQRNGRWAIPLNCNGIVVHPSIYGTNRRQLN